MRRGKHRALILFFFVSLQTENSFKYATAAADTSDNNQQEYNDILADIKTWSPAEAIITDIL